MSPSGFPDEEKGVQAELRDLLKLTPLGCEASAHTLTTDCGSPKGLADLESRPGWLHSRSSVGMPLSKGYMSIQTCVCPCMSMCASVCVCMDLHLCACRCPYMYANMCVSMHVLISVSINASVCAHACVFMCVHVHVCVLSFPVLTTSR